MAKYQNERVFKVSWSGPYGSGSDTIKALNPYHAIELSNQPLVSKTELHTVPIFRELQELVMSRGGKLSVMSIK
jgi:hypothetical protein